DDWVLVHDAARPCLQAEDLANLMETLKDDAVGGLLAAPVVDTLKRVDEQGRAAGTQDRSGLWRALTPQMFRYELLLDALRGALAAGVEVTDEACAVEWAGRKPLLVSGGIGNIKVTRPEDLPLAAAIMRSRMIKS
ncbi:MAG TPA: 2-C-methyl-D-erythritol 4-phosphate cytidylyltransferase, partial [Gammaproteobacteria bacterium]|nr:2-C-methyl-D-erythritol 4-phosphate cytidylyltransferase [Gammaproteobacteria bacterium]